MINPAIPFFWVHVSHSSHNLLFTSTGLQTSWAEFVIFSKEFSNINVEFRIFFPFPLNNPLGINNNNDTVFFRIELYNFFQSSL